MVPVVIVILPECPQGMIILREACLSIEIYMQTLITEFALRPVRGFARHYTLNNGLHLF